MDGAFDIPDPTDWLETPLRDFSPLENALHCDICKEFYDTPMITSCCHTFCSKCIRTCLSTNGKCPSCQAADQASKLRNNWILQTVVEQFLAARPAALDVARREQQLGEQAKKPGKRKRAVLDSDELAETEQNGRITRGKSRRIAASQTSQPETIEIGDSDGDEAYEPEKEVEDGLVECLFGCGKRVKPDEMSTHLDRCEQEKQERERAKSRTPVNSSNSRRPPAQDRKAPERISELNYSLLNDKKLRQKLEDAGIPNWGARQLMIKRHTEWVNLWNANCDSGGKKGQRELLRDLDSWERTQGGRAPNQNGPSSSVMRKDFDGAGWMNTNRQDFSRLIADAKRKKSNPASDSSKADAIDKADVEAEYKTAGDTIEGDNARIELQPQTEDQPSHDEELNDPEHPYENNPEAISSIREKVEAANAGQHVEPHINAGFEPIATNGQQDTSNHSKTAHSPPVGATHEALLEQSHWGATGDGHVSLQSHTSQPCDLGEHLSSDVAKVPMFAVPTRPFSDVDGGHADVGGK